MISKYNTNFFKFAGDDIVILNPKVYRSEGFLINYGMCKSAEERNETLARRKRAWALGNPKRHGGHYLTHKQRNWQWTKEEFTDIRTTKYYKLMNK